MSKHRDELLVMRKVVFERLEKLRKIGDYSAGAADIREIGEALLKLTDNILERIK